MVIKIYSVLFLLVLASFTDDVILLAKVSFDSDSVLLKILIPNEIVVLLELFIYSLFPVLVTIGAIDQFHQILLILKLFFHYLLGFWVDLKWMISLEICWI